MSNTSDLTKLLDVARQNIAVDSGFNLPSFLKDAPSLTGRGVSLFTLPITGFTQDSIGEDINTVDVPTAGITAVTLNLGDGSDTIAAGGVVVADQAITITNTGALLTLNGPVRNTSNNITISGANQVTLGSTTANIGGTVSGDPAVFYNPSYRSTEIYVNSGGHAAYTLIMPGGGWFPWNDLGGALTSDPSVVLNPSTGNTEIYANAGGNLVTNVWIKSPGAWSGWSSLM